MAVTRTLKNSYDKQYVRTCAYVQAYASQAYFRPVRDLWRCYAWAQRIQTIVGTEDYENSRRSRKLPFGSAFLNSSFQYVVFCADGAYFRAERHLNLGVCLI